MQNIDFIFTSDLEQIYHHLVQSKINNTVVAISAPVLGNGVFLTAVDDITKSDDDQVITLKGYDVTGYILERNKLRLSEIRAVCPFTSMFKNPYLKELTGERFYEVH
jgi:hypothetical protein